MKLFSIHLAALGNCKFHANKGRVSLTSRLHVTFSKAYSKQYHSTYYAKKNVGTRSHKICSPDGTTSDGATISSRILDKGALSKLETVNHS